MKIKNIAKEIECVLGKSLGEKGFIERQNIKENGTYIWEFICGDMGISIEERFRTNLFIKFALYNIPILIEKHLVSFLPETTLKEKIYGFAFSDEEDLRKLLLRLKPIIMEQGIPWMEETYAKYKK